MSTAKKYCYEKAAKPDAPLYYSLKKLTPLKRDRVVAVHAFYQEIEDVVLHADDSELALTKLNWWKAQVSHGQIDHPVLSMLHSVVPPAQNIQEKLLLMIEGVEDNLFARKFMTFEEIVIHFMRTFGARELLIHELSENDVEIDPEIIYQFMLVIELVNHMQYLRAYVRRNIIYFPQNECMQFGVTHGMLRGFKITPPIKNLLQYQAEKIEKAYVHATNNLSRAQRKALSYLLIRAEIARTLLREIRASDFNVLENLIMLTPLRYSWIAWRA